jgi:amino acid adenylation domain-containing protein
LATLPPAPELPQARATKGLTGQRFVRRTGFLSAWRWTRLKARAATLGLTPSGVLLAAYGEVLATWSKSPRFTLNVTTFNRLPLHPQVNDVLGDFTTLTLVAIGGSIPGPFAARARAVQQQLWDDLEHRYVGGIKVLRRLSQLCGGTSQALMPVVFTSLLLGEDGEREVLAEVDDGPREGAAVFGVSQTPQVTLDHQVAEHAGALLFNWDAVEDLFPAGLLDDLFAAYHGLLERLAAEDWEQVGRPGPPPLHLDVQRAANDTVGPLPDGLLHQAFEEWAARDPERIAVVAVDRIWTYGELDRLANRLARRLRGLEVRPNELVAVVMEKGWQQVVATLAVVKSGAAYLPVDPHLPRVRRWRLLEVCKVRVAFSQAWLSEELEWPEGIERLAVEPEPAEFADTPLEPAQRPDDLAYVIFTSGSTGEPKGVMIEHRAALNTIADINERFAVGPDDRVLALSGLGFDLSVYDLFGLLARGGAIILPSPSGLRDPEHWAELVERQRISIWNTVPALMEMLLESGAGDGRSGSLRLALLSGDWIPLAQPDGIRRMAPNCQVVSLGGATEAAIWSVAFPVGEVDPSWSSIPYGRPLRNQTLHILDHDLLPRPVWVPGDLYIGGQGLARGYWDDEEKTATKFVQSPDGRRLYHTGDLGRLLPDGNLEFLGREDFQVKIRGHRIELGEIESALHQIDGVKAAAVVAAGEERTQRRLVAYVVLKERMRVDSSGPKASIVTPEVRAGSLYLSDQFAKLEFKLQEPGLRRDLAGQPAVSLPASPRDKAWLDRFSERRSYREFLQESLPAEALARLLAALSVPGAIPPELRLYLYVRPGRTRGIPGGTYLFDPWGCSLEPVAIPVEIDPTAYTGINRPIFDQSAFALFLVGSASHPGQDAEEVRQSLLQGAGRVGQRLMEESPACGIGLCPIGSVDLSKIGAAGWLDGASGLVHSFLGGGIPASAPDAKAPLSVPASAVEALGRFLGSLQQVRLPEFPMPKYRYPSAGNLYPVQVYLHVQAGRISDLPGGIYYYHPRDHALFLLSPDPALERGLAPIASGAEPHTFALFLVGRLSAIEPVYGPLAMDFCQLETGYIERLLEMAAGEVGIALEDLAPPEAGMFAEDCGLEDGQILLRCLVGRPASSQAWETETETVAQASTAKPAGHSPIVGDPVAYLRERLGEVLPDCMVPAQFLFLDTLPLTANGKVDRRALPEPDRVAGLSAATYVAPKSETERRIAALWREILGQETLGINDNFFTVGGTSLHLIQIRNRLGEDFGDTVSVATLFKYPTIASLAAALSQGPDREEESKTRMERIEKDTGLQKQALKHQRKLMKQKLNANE